MSFCSLTKGITLKIFRLCVCVIINKHSFEAFMRLDLIHEAYWNTHTHTQDHAHPPTHPHAMPYNVAVYNDCNSCAYLHVCEWRPPTPGTLWWCLGCLAETEKRRITTAIRAMLTETWLAAFCWSLCWKKTNHNCNKSYADWNLIGSFLLITLLKNDNYFLRKLTV